MTARSDSAQSGKVVGPLDRGHDPVAVVKSVAWREVPQDWWVFDVFALKHDRVKMIVSRSDRLTKHYEITYDAINAGMTKDFVLDAVEDLRAAKI